MRDTFEEELVDRLVAVAETVDDEVVPPADLELLVHGRRRRERAVRRWVALTVAAAVVAAATTVAVVRGTTGGGSLRIATSSTTTPPVHDGLLPGTVMLSARGRDVISLDAAGHRNATMVHAVRGDIQFARVTADHSALWYLSLKRGLDACGDVVRADIERQTSRIVTHAVRFDVSPDGTRLALYGAGDPAHDHCAPVRTGSDGRLVVLDLAHSTSSEVVVGEVNSVVWSPDGSYVLTTGCGAPGCTVRRVDVPAALGAPLHVTEGPAPYPSGSRLAASATSIAFGPADLFGLEVGGSRAGATPAPTVVVRYDARSVAAQHGSISEALAAATPVLKVGAGWTLSQLVPAVSATYVIATHTVGGAAKAGLYRIDAGRLVEVRPLTDPGSFTPVMPVPTP